jgi:hypothetical protein
MDVNPDGILTIFSVVIGAGALGAAMFYAMTQRRRRDNAAMEHAGKQPDA